MFCICFSETTTLAWYLCDGLGVKFVLEVKHFGSQIAEDDASETGAVLPKGEGAGHLCGKLALLLVVDRADAARGVQNKQDIGLGWTWLGRYCKHVQNF